MSPKKPVREPKNRVVTVRLTTTEDKRLAYLARELGINKTDVLVEGMRMARDFDRVVRELDTKDKKVLRKLFLADECSDKERQDVADEVLSGLIKADVTGVRRRAQLAIKLLRKRPRPPAGEGLPDKDETVTVRLTKNEEGDLKNLADRLKMTKSDTLIEGVRMVEDLCSVIQGLGFENKERNSALKNMVMGLFDPHKRRELAEEVLTGMIKADFMRAGNRERLALRLLEEEDTGSPADKSD